MLHLGMWIATCFHRLFDYTPASLIIARTRNRQCLRWAIPAMGVGLLFFLIAATLAAVIKQSAPGWLNLLVIVLIIDGLRLLMICPFVVALLIRVRMRVN